jgi:hypothetical protein
MNGMNKIKSNNDEDLRAFPGRCYPLECSLVRRSYSSSTPLAHDICDYKYCYLSVIGVYDGDTRCVTFAREFIAITITAIETDGLASVV